MLWQCSCIAGYHDESGRIRDTQCLAILAHAVVLRRPCRVRNARYMPDEAVLLCSAFLSVSLLMSGCVWCAVAQIVCCGADCVLHVQAMRAQTHLSPSLRPFQNPTPLQPFQHLLHVTFICTAIHACSFVARDTTRGASHHTNLRRALKLDGAKPTLSHTKLRGATTTVCLARRIIALIDLPEPPSTSPSLARSPGLPRDRMERGRNGWG